MTDQPPAHGCTINGQPAMPILVAEYNQLIAELAALRAVARGYCPACGRGDAAPTVADWEQQKQRADKAEETSRRLLEQRQEMAEERYAWQQRGDRAERDARIYRDRLERLTDGYAEQFRRLEAVRKLRDDMRGSSETRLFADQLDGALGTPPAPAATQANEPREHCGQNESETKQ